MRTRKFILPLLSACLLLPALARAQAQASARPSGVVNINTATAQQISYLPRVGLKVAERIVDHRKTKGSFQRVEDLMEVKGIGEKQFLTLKPHLTVTGSTTLSSKIKSTGTRAGHARSKRAPKQA